MRSRQFIQCDVFTDTPTRGNALAVVLDAEGLSDAQMFAFAAWTNLAETTFILPPTNNSADYRLRIFTPTREMPFAGHPTLGSCHAWLHAGGTPANPSIVRQECGVGLVDIELNREMPAFVAPPTSIEALDASESSRIIEKLGLTMDDVIDIALLDNGPIWKVFQLISADKVLQANSSAVRWPDETPIGLIGAHTNNSVCDHEVRMLAPSSGMSEDPITGSLNSALAHWFLNKQELPDAMVVAQGTSINRSGRVYIANEQGRVLIGGQTHVLVEGTVLL